VTDEDSALTELAEAEPAEDEDIDALLASATFRVIVTDSTASLLLIEVSPLTTTPGVTP
jgi:hypothetical protein